MKTMETIERAKTLILRVLAGTVTPETDPAVFDDDLLYFGVAVVEQNDPDWIYGACANELYTIQARERCIACLSPGGVERFSHLFGDG
jgi:hypothetical protein